MSERTQRMVRMYVEEGLSYAEIGRRFDISRQRVHQLIGELVESRPDALAAQRAQGLAAAHGRVMRNETTLAEEAERLGYASADSLRSVMARRGLKFEGRPRPRPPAAPHGTRRRYTQGCHCDACRSANARYCRERRENKEAPTHGTESGYRNYGCKCKACKEAGARAQREYRARVRRKRQPRGTAARGRRITS